MRRVVLSPERESSQDAVGRVVFLKRCAVGVAVSPDAALARAVGARPDRGTEEKPVRPRRCVASAVLDVAPEAGRADHVDAASSRTPPARTHPPAHRLRVSAPGRHGLAGRALLIPEEREAREDPAERFPCGRERALYLDPERLGERDALHGAPVSTSVSRRAASHCATIRSSRLSASCRIASRSCRIATTSG